ncbi:MAG: Gfo/Idh/MocA family oxidoreductase [Armatimonadota bacterium]|nr:Gfo/Idh/MocA family oxidoreductase [Armatimonadota bacterium]
MSDTLGLGMLGCGVIAGAWLRALRAADQALWHLAAVCDREPEKARAAAGANVPAYTEMEALLADPGVDAVLILLPNFLHADAAVCALEAGKPVLVEKPMATTLPECDRMIEAARRTGLPLMVGMVNRFHSAYREARRRLHAGEFGTLGFISEYCNYRTAPNWYIRPWLKQETTCGGGMFLQMGIHNLDRAVWLSGAAPVWAHAAVRDMTGIWADETAVATVGLESGAMVHFETDGRSFEQRNESVLHCTDATVHVSSSRLVVHHSSGVETLPFTPDGFANELREFGETVRHGRPLAVDGTEGRRALALVLACYQSHRTGVRIPLHQPPWSGPIESQQEGELS